eukprot:Nitzschia sp. Nitz4//scaffold6_size259037//190208//191125//NITZ4_001101-RA/size259037-processed-gene-0.87-mRNA-1//-1//CDS//3329556974//6074//frame0
MPRVGGPGRPKGRPPRETSSTASAAAETDDNSTATGDDAQSKGRVPLTPTPSTEANNTTPTDPDPSYTAPSWLIQRDKHTPKFFSVPIPPVATATWKAAQLFMEQHWKASAPPPPPVKAVPTPSTRQTQEHATLKQEHKSSKQRIKHFKERLAQAQARKQDDLEQIRTTHQEQLDESMQRLTQRLQNNHDKSLQKKQDEMEKLAKERVEAKFQERKRQREEREAQEEKAPSPKVPRVSSNPSLKDEESVVQVCQKKIDEAQAKLDKLQEKKSEMVWLLKQVIKADAKREAELLKLKRQQAKEAGN